MSTVIKVENLSKQYRLGLVGASTFKEDTQRWWASLRGKENPFLHHGVENDRTINDESKFVWSLKDINFEVQKGDVLGIIGRNGAGKSTLLKILSKVTAPTTGSVKVKGRIASLLEVGTGFHPELTGRENIYLNGAILGMRKHEIVRKLEEIIAFAGVEKYVDTPVKRYSSGMYVRLAFAVAAHLESEILIIDEVLAVGDAEFQKKCLGKMGEVSKGEGRTILFVSHNVESIKTLCNKGLLLANGIVKNFSNINDVVDTYNNFIFSKFNKNSFDYKATLIKKNIPIWFSELKLETKNNNFLVFDEDIFIYVSYVVESELENSTINFHLKKNDINILWSFDSDFNLSILEKRLKGEYKAVIRIPKNILKPGQYKISFYAGIIGGENFESLDDILSFQVVDNNSDTYLKSYSERREGLIALPLKWDFIL